jgi:uncharacterized small protein (DUF1192 family)
MKMEGLHKNRIGHGLTAGWRVMVCLGVAVAISSSWAEDKEGGKKEKSKSSSLGDLLNNLKDMKVPDSVSKFPEQLKELKDAYLKTSKTVEELQKEVALLRGEVDALRAEQALLKKAAAVGSEPALAVQELTAEKLVSAFVEDSVAAKQQFEGRYLKVTGAIEGFETGLKEIVIFLRAESSDLRVKCYFKRDNDFHVEVIGSQGRLVSRNDRTTLLTIGQPVTIVGTCGGTSINVAMVNCHVEGIETKRKVEGN